MRQRQRTERATYFLTALRVAGGSRLLTAVFGCTAGINLMALTGPVYMAVLYDRVLNARDAQYLVGLTALMLVLYALSACLDIVRHGVLLRCAQRTDRTLSALLLGSAGTRGPSPISTACAPSSAAMRRRRSAICLGCRSISASCSCCIHCSGCWRRWAAFCLSSA